MNKLIFGQIFILLACIFVELAQAETKINPNPSNNNACNIKYCITCDQNTNECLKCENDLVYDLQLQVCLDVGPCPQGQFKTSTTSPCKNCHQTCKSCFDEYPQTCYDCVDGYIFSQDPLSNSRICVSCAIPNCRECFQKNQCRVCQEGFLLNKDTGQCEPCLVDYCEDCSNDRSKCSLCLGSYFLVTKNDKLLCVLKGNCPSGYYQDSQGSCNTKCDDSCLHCSGPGNQNCYQCNKGYYQENDKCLPCNPSCLTCELDDLYCTSCPPGKILSGSKCVDSCNYGEYNNNGYCEPCPPNCIQCTNANTCTKCTDPTQFQISNGSCVGKCNDGFYNQLSQSDYNLWQQYKFDQIVSDSNCQKCSPNCVTCSVLNNRCTSCSSGLILDSNNMCIRQCRSNEFLFYDKYFKQNRCIPCPYPCGSCQDQYSCSSCTSLDFKLESDGSCTYVGYKLGICKENQVSFSRLCLDQCPVGTILQGDICTCDFTCNMCLLNLSSLNTQCIVCKNTSQFQYQGVCYDKCPSDQYSFTTYYFDGTRPYFYNTCASKCPNNLLNQVSTTSRSCVSQCSKGYKQILNTCVDTPCSQKQYFDSVSYSNDVSKSINKDLQSYCKDCDQSCANCDGKESKNCLSCASNYYQQMRISDTDDLNSYSICLSSCDKGYYVPNGTSTCKLCQSQCSVCASGLYSILTKILDPSYKNDNVYECLSNCPPGTIANNDKFTCDVKTEINIFVDRNDSTISLFSVQSNIKIVLAITTVQVFSQNPTNSCQVTGLNFPLQMQNSNDGQYTKFYGYIPANTLQEGQTYEIVCKAIIDGVTYTDTEQISTFKLIPGSFTVDSQSGTALNQTFNFNISGFYIQDLNVNDYQLQYQLSVQMATISQPYNNHTIFYTDKYFYINNPDQAQGLNYTVPYIFSQISDPAKITVFLTVQGVQDLSRVFSLQISLNPNTQTQNQQQVSLQLQQIINQLQLNQNTPINLASLSTFTTKLQSINIVPSLDQGLKQSIAIQKMISNQPFIDKFITCNPDKDCSGQGTCKSNITSYFNKCDCFAGFSGEICSWKTVDLNQVQSVYNRFLDQSSSLLKSITQNSSSATNQLSSLINSMFNLAQIRDIFNSQITDKFLKLLNAPQIYTSLNSIQATNQLLSVNDLAIDILRKASINNQISSSLIQSIQNNFAQSLYLLQNNLSRGQQMNFQLSNVNAQISDLYYANFGGNQQVSIEGDGTSPQSSWEVDIPTSQLGFYSTNLYSQVVVYPCDFQGLGQQYNENSTYDLIASSIIDITIRQKNNMNQFKVQNTATPISITLNRQISDKDMTYYKLPYTLNCTYQLDDGTWTSDGLNTIQNSDGTFTCKTNHLTNFAIQIQSYNPNYYQNPLKNNNQDNSSGTDFQQSLFIGINFALILAIGHLWAGFTLKRNYSNKSSLQQQISNNQELEQNNIYLQQNNGIAINVNINQNDQLDSIFNQPHMHQLPNQQTLKLEGVHVAPVQQFENQQMVAGLPIFGETETKKIEIKSKNKASKLQIDQVNIDNANIVNSNPQNIDIIAQNLARRLKEQEIDMAHQDDSNGEGAKNFKEKEVNIIPISTFYNQGNYTNSASPQTNLLQNAKMIDDQPKGEGNPFTLEVSPDIMQGVPIQENDEQRERAESLRKYVEKLDKNKQYVNLVQQEKLRLLLYYHPIFSFTHPLHDLSVPMRTILFFQIIALYQWLTLSSLKMETSMNSLSFSIGLSIFFQVLLGKALLQYVIPAFLYILASIEKACFSRVRFGYSSIMKYICVIVLTLYSLIMFSGLTSSNMNTIKEFTNFITLLIIIIVGDYFIVDYFIIKLYQSCNSILILRLIKAKNLCIGDN